MKLNLVLIAFALSAISYVKCLDNGLALTPPMGWISWARFGCNTDCKKSPSNCISENLFLTMANLLDKDGYKDLGYQYINIDDCYLSKTRNIKGELEADPSRFPHGLQYLAEQIHKLGLRFGVYEDYGTKTCGGYPGILGHLQKDADTIKDWQADMLKLDGCNVKISMMNAGYPEMGKYLNETGRPILYSCSWPDYQRASGMKPNYTRIAEVCNLWRVYNDISFSWASVSSIIDYFGDNQDVLIPHAGPGHWNDPDMIIVGNPGLSYDQSKAQMAIWSILAAPLLMSNDLRQMEPEFKAILQNREIIAVDQDPMGIQGRRIYKKNEVEIWRRPITPKQNDQYSYAIAVLYRGTGKKSKKVALTFKDIGLTYSGGYEVKDLYTHKDLGPVKPNQTIIVDVNPTGVVMLKATI